LDDYKKNEIRDACKGKWECEMTRPDEMKKTAPARLR
jgi:hypothetical protein